MQLKKVRVKDIITAKYQMRFNTLKGTFGIAKKDIDSLARSIKMNGLLCPPSVTRQGSSGHSALCPEQIWRDSPERMGENISVTKKYFCKNESCLR